MATALSASFSVGDTSPDKFRRIIQPHQSIPQLRRERTMMDESLSRNNHSRPSYSNDVPLRARAFSGGMNGYNVFFP